MRKYLLIIIMSVIACGTSSSSIYKVRKPSVSGQFYPSGSKELKKTIQDFLDNVPDTEINGEILSCMAPHAGYVYSGQLAAYVHKLLSKTEFETIVIIGHNAPRRNYIAYLSGMDYFRTPLGDVPVDKEMVNAIADFHPGIIINDDIHAGEHTIEVHLPFLQILKKKFKIVPILFGVPDEKNSKILAEAIIKASKDKKILLFASTDLSHYPAYKDAVTADKSTLGIIEKLDAGLLFSHLKNLERSNIPKLTTGMCASGGVGTAIIYAKAKGADTVKILKYANSGDVSFGNKSGVVGYGVSVIYKNKDRNESRVSKKKENRMGYTDKQKIKLLKIARDTIETYVRKGKIIQVSVNDKELEQERGVFVTLHKDGRLRGCIGNIMPADKLYLAVRNMAIQSSTKDPRFPAVQEDELADIELEISVLTVPEEVSSADDIVLGRDGVIVKKGFRQGVYLPQVATETGWSLEEFLSSLCYSKAGLQPDAWKDKDTQLITFQAEVFNEEELGIK